MSRRGQQQLDMPFQMGEISGNQAQVREEVNNERERGQSIFENGVARSPINLLDTDDEDAVDALQQDLEPFEDESPCDEDPSWIF